MILSYFHWIIRCSLNHLKSCQRTWSSGFTHTLVLWNSMYIFQFFNYECKEKGKGSGVWPSMVTHTQNFFSAFNPSKCTHTVVKIHPEQWAANAAVPGEQLGVRCLAQGSHPSHGIEGGESAGYSLPPTDNPCRTWDSNPRPSGYKSNSLSIRPQLPLCH